MYIISVHGNKYTIISAMPKANSRSQEGLGVLGRMHMINADGVNTTTDVRRRPTVVGNCAEGRVAVNYTCHGRVKVWGR